jgi:hypothetical protein
MQLCTTATNFSPLFSSDSEQTQTHKPQAAEAEQRRTTVREVIVVPFPSPSRLLSREIFCFFGSFAGC